MCPNPNINRRVLYTYNGVAVGSTPTDPIPAIAGVVLYLDGANTSKSTSSVWTDSSNNGITATAGAGADAPTRDEANRKWSFAGGDYFALDKKVYCNYLTGFRIFAVVDRTIGDDTLFGSSANVSGDWVQFLFRNSTNISSIQGGIGPTLAAATGADLCLIEINYDGAGNWNLLKDGSSIATAASPTLTIHPGFDQIGRYGTNTTQAWDGDIKAFVLYNGQNASNITTIRETLQAKFITETMDADIAYATPSAGAITMLAKYGDSFTVGRSPDTELTGDYAYLTGPISGALIFNRLTSGAWETYNAGTRYSAQMLSGDLGNECGFFDDATSLAIVKYGIGGATLGTSGGAGKLLSKASADQYPLMERQIKLGYQELKGQGYTVTFDHFFLDMLTNDSYDATDAGNVATALPTLMTNINADFGITFNFMSQEILTGPHKATVNAALAAEAGSNANFDYMTSQDSSLTDSVHRTAPAAVVQGRYMNANWLGA